MASASDTSLRVTWSTPGTPTGEPVTGYQLQYRESGTISWTSGSPTGTDRAYTIENLTTGTRYEVQVNATNSSGTGEWSPSGTGTPGYVPPPPPPPPPPPRPVSSFQPVEELFRSLSSTGSLTRVWRFLPRSQTWLFYDPDPRLRPFNTMRTLNMAEDPPNIVVIGVERVQRFRGLQLYPGWNIVPIAQRPPTPGPGVGTQSIRQLLAPLIRTGTLERVWWLDSRTQEWKFFDPDPALAAFNTISTVNLAANPPVELMVNVSRGQQFRGHDPFPDWNHVLIR